MHVHIIWTRSRRDGRLVSLANDYYSHRDAVHRAAEEIFGLREIDRIGGAQRSAAPTDTGVRAAQRAHRRGTRPAWVDPAKVKAAIATSRDMRELASRLQASGIESAVSTRASGQARGLLLRAAGAQEWLAASSVDRSLALPRVQAQLAANAARMTVPPPVVPVQRPSPAVVSQRPRGG
jgi:hypothetical protein